MNEKTGRILRTVAIVFIGLTAAMNILGGAGTTCAAFGITRADRIAFADLYDYKWLYQILVVTTILIGLAGVWATIALAKGKRKAFRNTLIVLIIGTVLGAVQFIASMALRGEATPANVKFLANAVTLVLFLFIRVPSIWQHVDFSAPESRIDGATAGGLAAIVAGVIVMTVPSWAGPSHTFFGENRVNVLLGPVTLGGLTLIVVGLLLLARQIIKAIRSSGMVLEPRQTVPNEVERG
jgi:hypothetical protein